MADRNGTERDEHGQAGFQDGDLGGGLRKPGYGRGYGRDFGAGGRNQGFDGSWGQGYGASSETADDRSWIDRRAEANAGPHAGRGPRGWVQTDDRVREAVSEALMHDRLLDARGIGVQVEAGVVTLTGQVPGPSDIRLAERIVRDCRGVQDVRAELEVSGRPRQDLHLGGEAPNPYRPPGEDHAPTAHQRNIELGEGKAH